MDSNVGLGARIFSNMGGGMLGLEMPLQPPPPPPSQLTQPSHQNPIHHQHQPQPQGLPSQMVVAYGDHELDPSQTQPQLSLKQAAYPCPASVTNKPRPQYQRQTGSDEDEPYSSIFGGNDDGSGSIGEKRKASPWHRMKWTDNMVRLLIMAVYFIGDDNTGADDHKKKSSGGNSNGGGAGGLLQKKGKWKSVSKAMMEKGFYVSPQQCEDKFNDLNKRYKRVNDILGKGTACKVVENQSLLETMNLTPKMKDEAKKLLNSKHLFFREMCAYHNTCEHGSSAVAGAGGCGTGGSGGHRSPDETTTEQSHLHHLQQGQQQQLQQQGCLHSALPNSRSRVVAAEVSKMVAKADSEEDDEVDDDDDDDEGEYGDDDDHHREHGHSDDDHIECPMRKRRKEIQMPTSPLVQRMSSELMTMMQDVTKSSMEKKQWMVTRLMQLEEEGIKSKYEAFTLEKQRLNWMQYRSKKERDMERMKLENEQKSLENERLMLILRQKIGAD